ncbi:NADH-quinone oxidoreductase subunit A [Arcicella rosea]|uniref:NADH-quinone oxidoreductase subunit A n=1 Tax=Arcicella rosea TaxID=502909 RepID=A0A841EHW4_9BACT|nr:NADH-quinone oxidoreductase subunit A [Arcicella rosea]MBB6001834.1 NADH-quinone oxidoreductase subunit A [Arcicella rosea]
MNYQPSDFLPILVQLVAALAFIVATMLATHWLGPKRHSVLKDDAFECGIESVGDARTPISVKYFLVAILFVLFDVEIIFMYPWAVNFMGWVKSTSDVAITMFLEMLVFMGLLLLGFIYVIKKGVLTWEK